MADVDPASPTPRLRTARLVLRGWLESDLEPFAALNADPEVAEFLGGALTREQSDAMVGRFVERWRLGGVGHWAVERVADGAFLGFVGLGVPAWAPGPETEIGWRLARHAWGAGYGTEAAREAVRFAFEAGGLAELVSYTAATNARSRRVMEKLGMVRADPGAAFDFLHPRLRHGDPLRPHVTYRLGREAWERRTLRGMDKATLLRDIRAGHEPIEAAVAALDDEALLAPAPGMPGWTRKDVLAHLEWWHEHSSNVIDGARTGIDPYPGGDEPWDLDEQNAQTLAQNRGRSAADVRDGEAASFARLVAMVDGATEDELFREDPHPWLDGTLAETVTEDSSGHYPEHVPHLS